MGHPHAQVLGVLLCKERTDRALMNLENICNKMLCEIFPVGQTHHSRCSGKQIPINTIIYQSIKVQVETPLVKKKKQEYWRLTYSRVTIEILKKMANVAENLGVASEILGKMWEWRRSGLKFTSKLTS